MVEGKGRSTEIRMIAAVWDMRQKLVQMYEENGSNDEFSWSTNSVAQGKSVNFLLSSQGFNLFCAIKKHGNNYSVIFKRAYGGSCHSDKKKINWN